MSEKKEFNRKYMHPTRRKLAEMVFTGEYELDPRVGYTASSDTVKREVGEKWTDSSGQQWEMTEWGKSKVSSLTDVMSETRKYLASLTKCKSTDCPKSKYGVTDKKLIQKVGYCTTCLARHEWEIKKDGLWETYTEFRIYTNMIKEGTATLENMRNALTEIKNIHEYVNADGSIQKWVLEQDTDKLKEELLEDIQKGEKELNEVIEKRKQVYELLKDKEYEIIQKI